MSKEKENNILINGEAYKLPKDLENLKDMLAQKGEDTFQIGEKIYNIGEIGQAEFTNIIHQNFSESKTSQYLKIFLYVFVPLLAIGLAFLYIQTTVLQQPVNLTITLNNLTPNKDLPLEKAKISLTYGDKTETQEVDKEATFKGIPANFKGKKLTLKFESPGFISVDTTMVLNENALVLPIRRNNALSKIFGLVKDENGKALAGVKITIQEDISTISKEDGSFSLQIPFDKQRKEQTIRAFKEGYKTYTRLEPIIENEETLILMEK
jgi:hypothetical protein